MRLEYLPACLMGHLEARHDAGLSQELTGSVFLYHSYIHQDTA